MIHTGNSFMREDGILVVDATIYEDKKRNVYEVFDFDKLKTKADMLNHQWGGVWKRFELDFKTKKVDSFDLARLENGNLEVPTFNKKFDGI